MAWAWNTIVVCGCAALVACGGEEEDGPNCGTAEAPETLSLRDVQPAQGSSVANDAIVHAFTIAGRNALFELELTPGAAHTAGLPDPMQTVLMLDTSTADLRYTFSPLRWSTAPGNVVLQNNGRFQTPDGCVYMFPSPLFSYAITP